MIMLINAYTKYQVDKYFGFKEKAKQKVPDYFECRITMNIMRDPVILQSGFTY